MSLTPNSQTPQSLLLPPSLGHFSLPLFPRPIANSTSSFVPLALRISPTSVLPIAIFRQSSITSLGLRLLCLPNSPRLSTTSSKSLYLSNPVAAPTRYATLIHVFIWLFSKFCLTMCSLICFAWIC